MNALALLGRYFPMQCCLQLTDLDFAAFDHLFPPNQMVRANHTSRPENNALRCSIPATERVRFNWLWKWYYLRTDASSEPPGIVGDFIPESPGRLYSGIHTQPKMHFYAIS